MAGAIAGSAILGVTGESKTLDTVTFTVNNLCNFKCPHCYLQYQDQGRRWVSPQTLDYVFSSRYRHLAIVGKEPLVDERSALACIHLIDEASKRGQSVSVITNGTGIRRLPARALAGLAYIDVSLDGGPATYESYRGGDYARLLGGLRSAVEKHSVVINALQVLNSATIHHVSDMVTALDDFPFGKMLFFPYLKTKNDGVNLVAEVSLADTLEALSASARFTSATEALLLVDELHLAAEGIPFPTARQMIRSAGLQGKVVVLEDDPLNMGFIRLTFDRYVLTPYQSIHPSDYRESGIRLAGSDDTPDLAELYDRLRRDHAA